MVRDAHGRKMSKSLGNGIDPLEVINGESLAGLQTRLGKGNLDPKELVIAKEGQVKDFPNGIPECGADALRFALVSYTTQSYNINMDVQRVVCYRQWCNKMWNAVRFAMMKLGDNYTPPVKTLCPETMPFSCKWILSVLNKAVTKTVDSLNAFELADAANTVYSWWQYQFCDVFIEAIKPCFSGENSDRTHAQDTLWVCLETGLRLLHPFMPFVTEELWQRLPSPKGCEREASIMICEYPSPIEEWTDKKVEAEMEMVMATVKTIRTLRAAESMERQRNEKLHAFALCGNITTLEIMQSHELEIRTLASLSSFEVVLKGEDRASQAGSAVVETVNENLKVYLKVDGAAIDPEAEREKMRKKIEEIQNQKEKLEKSMGVSWYEEKVPAHIKEENARKLAKLLQDGIGKTTLAKRFYNKIIENFEEQRVFISNVREKSSGQDGLVNLQKTFITELFRSAPEIEDVNIGREKIREKIHEKKILAVLVDVDSKDQVDVLVRYYGLIVITTRDEEILNRLSVNQKWCNKMWNAVRFAMMKLGDNYTPPVKTLCPETMPFSCKWILSVLNKAVTKTVDSLNAFELADAGNTVYSWWQYQFCDVFIEAIKPCFSGENLDRTHAQDTLWVCLETGLRLLHPFMPFVTEELWQRLPSPKGCEREASIMICEYPSPIEEWTDEKVEAEMEMVMATVKTIRTLRAAESMERQRNDKLHAFALCGNITTLEIMQSHELEIRTLASLSSFEVVLKGEDRASQAGSAVVETVNENLKVYLKVDGAAIDPEAEREKMRKKIEEIQNQKEKLEKSMGVSWYEEKVPAHIKEENARKLEKLLQELDLFQES
ncbi:hypothetical protein DY000_02023528 [Brassica cretica]|uniref:valine--tRNA ligase n=1 Tax=Brassica cretica TaxID=69181 RepID=A0ABQ7E058_BRACR|nr:hypothetical protein DY000_02023528 [Brassica cretica]